MMYKKGRETENKLNKFFKSVFIAEGKRQKPEPDFLRKRTRKTEANLDKKRI